MNSELKSLREAIDRVDGELLRLLNERMRLVQEVGQVKAAKGFALFDPGREESIYENLTKINAGPLTDVSLRSIYRQILAASRMLQYPVRSASRESDWTRRQNTEQIELSQKMPLLCGCLVDSPIDDLPRVLHHPAVELLEWRLDLFAEHYSREKTLDCLQLLRSAPRHPVLATNRPREQGGAFEGSLSDRVAVLMKAAQLGAEWVDLEDDVPEDSIEWFVSRSVRVVLSYHDFSGTADFAALRQRLERMAGRGASVVKIVTYARSHEDNLRTLELIPFGKKELGVEVIAFCMGPLGRWSRVASLLLGSPWAYVRFPEESGSAPGQFSAVELRAVWEALA